MDSEEIVHMKGPLNKAFRGIFKVQNLQGGPLSELKITPGASRGPPYVYI